MVLVTLFFSADEIFAQPGKKGKGNGKGGGHPSHKAGKKGGGPPPWAPAHGYRAKTRHVFFKDYDTYYDLQKGVYISMKNGKWEISAKLPLPLQKVDLNKAAQLELDMDLDDPQRFYKEHKRK